MVCHIQSAGSNKEEKPKKTKKGKTNQESAKKQPQKQRRDQKPGQGARIEELIPELEGASLEEHLDDKVE